MAFAATTSSLRRWIAGGAAAAAFAAASPAGAQPLPGGAGLQAPPSPEADVAAPKSVRMALSARAEERLIEMRVRRLLSIELTGVAELAAEANGPLGEDIVRVWIDVPSPDRAIIEVRRTDRSLARRILDIGGFPGDLAARVVAIAASEMVRVQARAAPRPPQPSTPGGDAHGRGKGYEERFTVDAAASVLLLPTSEPLALGGPELGLEHRHGITAQTLYARWLLGEGGQRARWFELGASMDVRLGLSPMWTLRLAAKAGGVALNLPEAVRIEDRSSSSDWTVRAGGLVGIEARIARTTTLGLAIEPGASVRRLHVLDAAGTQRELGGFALGISLGVLASPFEPPGPPAAAQPSK